MKHWYDRKAKTRSFVLVLFPVTGYARYQGPYIVEKKINELDYVIQTPDRRKSSQLCHINMMKEYHGRDVVDNAAVAVVSTESVCDDLNEKSCSDFFAAVPESARMQNSDVLSNLDSGLKCNEYGRSGSGSHKELTDTIRC